MRACRSIFTVLALTLFSLDTGASFSIISPSYSQLRQASKTHDQFYFRICSLVDHSRSRSKHNLKTHGRLPCPRADKTGMAMSKTAASMTEFVRFHSMLVFPWSATRCVASIDGVVLFMPKNYKERGIAMYHVKSLNTWGYYLLVLFSLTGFSTALGMTEFLETSENFEKGLESPEVTEDIKDFVAQQSSTQLCALRVVRRFSFNFRITGLKVKMFHLSDADGKLHLVEIYEPPFPRWPLLAVMFPIAAAGIVALLTLPHSARHISHGHV